jgi:hypothetical protein
MFLAAASASVNKDKRQHTQLTYVHFANYTTRGAFFV